jgi:iron-sulfur cluster repair protein YtfE (RIC family)
MIRVIGVLGYPDPLLQSIDTPMRHPSLVLLSHDHHHGLALALRCRKQSLGQIKPMGAEGLRARAQEFLDFYRANLVAHFKAEEEVLFPLMRQQVLGCGVMIDQLVRDHEQLRRSVRQLEAGTGLAKLIFDLGDLLERHIRKEERELFPLFEAHVDEAQAEAMGLKIKEQLGDGRTIRMKDEG